jgi:hypothetical protein
LIFWFLIFDLRGRLVLAREAGLASVRQQGKFNFGSADDRWENNGTVADLKLSCCFVPEAPGE